MQPTAVTTYQSVSAVCCSPASWLSCCVGEHGKQGTPCHLHAYGGSSSREAKATLSWSHCSSSTTVAVPDVQAAALQQG